MTSKPNAADSDIAETEPREVDRLPDAHKPMPSTTEEQAADMDYEGGTPN